MSDEKVINEIGEVIDSLVQGWREDLRALSAEEIAAEWWWSWEEGRSSEWNTYRFSDTLELHKNRWREWEKIHHGPVCVVERVRDKYVMPRVKEFLAELRAREVEES